MSERESVRKTWTVSSTRSSRRSQTGWAWASLSVERSSRLMAAACGHRPVTRMDPPSASHCQLPTRAADREQPMKVQPESQSMVFVIDDDASMREAMQRLFRSVGLQAEVFASAAEFLRSKPADVPCCLVLDVRLPGLSGLDFQTEVAKANIQIPIIFMTGHGDIPMTVKAMKAGAIEFLPKPFRDQDMLDAVRLGLERDRVRLENDRS